MRNLLFFAIFIQLLSPVFGGSFPMPGGSGDDSGAKSAPLQKPKPTLDEKISILDRSIAAETELLQKNSEALGILRSSVRTSRIIKGAVYTSTMIGLCVLSDLGTSLALTTLIAAGYESVCYILRRKSNDSLGLQYDRGQRNQILKQAATAIATRKQALSAIKKASVDELLADENGLPYQAEGLMQDSARAQAEVSPIWTDLNAQALGLRDKLYTKKPGKSARGLGIQVLDIRGELITSRIEVLKAARVRLQTIKEQQARSAELKRQAGDECVPSLGLLGIDPKNRDK